MKITRKLFNAGDSLYLPAIGIEGIDFFINEDQSISLSKTSKHFKDEPVTMFSQKELEQIFLRSAINRK